MKKVSKLMMILALAAVVSSCLHRPPAPPRPPKPPHHGR